MKPNEAAEKQEIMYRLKNAGELYVLLSMCTGEPYVVCDQETYDDEIIVFFDSQAAVEEAKEQTEAGTPVRPMKLENKQFLIFYTSLYTLGVNALLVKDGGRNSLIQLQDFVKRNKQQGQETGEKAVSYTHLDVYKRQILRSTREKDTCRTASSAGAAWKVCLRRS